MDFIVEITRWAANNSIVVLIRGKPEIVFEGNKSYTGIPDELWLKCKNDFLRYACSQERSKMACLYNDDPDHKLYALAMTMARYRYMNLADVISRYNREGKRILSAAQHLEFEQIRDILEEDTVMNETMTDTKSEAVTTTVDQITTEKQPETVTTETTEKQPETVTTETTEKQPEAEISTSKARSVELIHREGGYSLWAQAVVNKGTLMIQAVILYLVFNDIPMIGADSPKISAGTIRKAKDHTILKSFNNFTMAFTEDELKCAFDKLQQYILAENFTESIYSGNVLDVLAYVVESCLENVLRKGPDSSSEACSMAPYILKKEQNLFMISPLELKTVLSGTGFTPVTFCKSLQIVENQLAKKIIITNRTKTTDDGKSIHCGYGLNTCGNIRYYAFSYADIPQIRNMLKGDK